LQDGTLWFIGLYHPEKENNIGKKTKELVKIMPCIRNTFVNNKEQVKDNSKLSQKKKGTISRQAH
jgi:hypothetical protein